MDSNLTGFFFVYPVAQNILEMSEESVSLNPCCENGHEARLRLERHDMTC